MKKGFCLLTAFIFIFIFSVSLVIAPPPVQTNTVIDTGVTIQYPKFEALKTNQDFTFHFHTFNATSGFPLTNTSLSCTFHLYNDLGKHIFEDNGGVGYDSNLIEWAVFIDGSNFSTIGNYAYIFECNSSSVGGFLSAPLMVSNTNVSSTTANAIFHTLITFFIFALFVMILYLNIIIPYKNRKNDKGQIIFLTRLKYLKLALIPITYGLFTWFLNLLLGISNYYVSLSIPFGLIQMIFNIIIVFAYPIIIIVIILYAYNFFKDYLIFNDLRKFGFHEPKRTK